MRSTHDMVVVGGGTGGAFAAATAASAGLDVVLLERKPPSEAGHIACGDAIKGKSALPDVIDREYLREESFTNRNVRRGIFETPETTIEIDLGKTGSVLDRRRYGEVILEEAERAGAAIHYDTVAQSLIQEDGVVRGVEAVRDGDPVAYEAPITIDAAGALSILQDTGDFQETTFDTNVTYQHFCSAYREILSVPDPVPWDDAIVFKPTQELGYVWYFPRTATEINAGLGFQMNKPAMELVDELAADLRDRPEFRGATVEDKLGAALPTRRPYDSAVAPGYLAVGDAAGHVNPTTGGGIVAAARAGHWAAEVACEAIAEGRAADETALWPYNERVMADFGKRFAALDLYNVWGGAHEVDELVSVIIALPGQQLVDVLSSAEASMGLGLKLRTLLRSIGSWDVLYEAYRVRQAAGELKALYERYPDGVDGFDEWRRERDAILERVYEVTGADPKY